MEYRQLGRSGLKVSALSLGTASFGGGITQAWGALENADAERQVDSALEAGINLIDTSNAYGKNGGSETVLGAILSANGRRNRTLVATKCRFPIGDGPNDRGLSRAHILSACEDSLKRLKTDVIDLYQVHEWDGLTPVEEVVDALDTLVQQGKVRYIGCSNYSGWHIMKTLAAADARIKARFVSQQIYYSLQCRDAENELLPVSIDQGLGVLVWSPLAGGLLTGKYRRDSAPKGGARHAIGFPEPPIEDREKVYDTIDVLVDVAEAHGVSGAQVALAWLLQRPAITSLIISGRTQSQLDDNLNVTDLELAPEDIARLDRVSQKPLLYPYWHQAMTASDRLGQADMALHGGREDKWDEKFLFPKE